jgi:hypothetical protein
LELNSSSQQSISNTQYTIISQISVGNTFNAAEIIFWRLKFLWLDFFHLKMKRKFNESAADYFYERIEAMENRIRSLNSCILDREEDRDISVQKAEELTKMIEQMDNHIEDMNKEVDRLTARLQRCILLYFLFTD